MGEKNLCVVGFGDKVICAQVHAHQLICFAVAASYDDDRHSGGFSHLPADIIAVKSGRLISSRIRSAPSCKMASTIWSKLLGAQVSYP